MWKSREAFEKSTFFKRLKIQGLAEVEALWSFLHQNTLKSQRVLRINPLRGASAETFRAESFVLGETLPSFPGIYRFDLNSNKSHSQHPFWGAGLGYVQDPVALEIVRDLDIHAGQWVLDLCAAPGGKSTRIAELLGPSGWLVCGDPDLKRARTLSGNLLRHGAHRSSVFVKDGVRLASFFPETFDRILLDVPCSGESLFFKREEKRRDVYESEVQELALLQSNLLNAAASSLKAGGRLVYSTCTYNLTENEENIRKFLKKNEDFSLIKEERRWPHLHQTAGGYWAVLEKRGSLTQSPSILLRHPDSDRHALLDADGKINSYAQAMLIKNFLNDMAEQDSSYLSLLNPLDEWILMTDKEAIAFLSGEAISNPQRKQGIHKIVYKGQWVLGAAKGVEGRFNNLLPLELRTQFRNFKS